MLLKRVYDPVAVERWDRAGRPTAARKTALLAQVLETDFAFGVTVAAGYQSGHALGLTGVG